MRKAFIAGAFAAALSSSAILAQTSTVTDISFITSDSVLVYGTISDPGDERPLILLFHQAGGDGRGEYSAIVPRLIQEGFSAMTIDQRLGGDRFGGFSRTMKEAGEEAASYCQVLPDLEAALSYAIDHFPDRSIILWGSSYSASLAIRLARDHGDAIAGVIAFSPASGEPMEGCRPEEAAAELGVPAMMLRPRSEMAFGHVGEQLQAFASMGHRTFIAESGVHGSSMLDSRRTGGNTEPTWQAVLNFLRAIAES